VRHFDRTRFRARKLPNNVQNGTAFRPVSSQSVRMKKRELTLRNIEGYLIELVCHVESIDGVGLIADVLVSVQDALRDLDQRPRST
jgi:hypothetical protein